MTTIPQSLRGVNPWISAERVEAWVPGIKPGMTLCIRCSAPADPELKRADASTQ